MKARALILAGEGYGNIIMATPMINAVARMGYETHALVRANWPDAANLLRGWHALVGVHEARADAMRQKWDVQIGTVWARCDATIPAGRYVAPKPLDMREHHEAEVNMTCAEQLGWAGAMPATHCEWRQAPNKSLWPCPYVVACPGFGGHSKAEWQRKSWPHWAEWARNVEHIVGLGSADDARLFSGIDHRPEWGRMEIDQAAGVMKYAACVVAVDNGLAHVAAALGVRTVVLFGPTSEKKNRPLGRDVRLVAAPVDCRPCQMTRRWDECQDRLCMEQITPAMVMEAMQ